MEPSQHLSCDSSRQALVADLMLKCEEEIEAAGKKARDAIRLLYEKSVVVQERSSGLNNRQSVGEVDGTNFLSSTAQSSSTNRRKSPRWKQTPRWPLQRPSGVRVRRMRLEVKKNGQWCRYIQSESTNSRRKCSTVFSKWTQ